jgi:hypothetical protein
LSRTTALTTGDTPLSTDDLDEIGLRVREDELIGIPVWAYVHGAATVRATWTNPFGCPWDSGRCGWAYIERKAWLAEFGRKRMSPKLLAKAHEQIRGHVEEFNRHINGEYYGYVLETLVDDEWQATDDQCWGFLGQENAAEEGKRVAQAYLDHLHKQQSKAVSAEVS